MPSHLENSLPRSDEPDRLIIRNENYDTKVLETLSARLALVEKAIGTDKLEEVKSTMSEAELEAIAGGATSGGGDRYLSDDEIDRQRRKKNSQTSMENYHER